MIYNQKGKEENWGSGNDNEKTTKFDAWYKSRFPEVKRIAASYVLKDEKVGIHSLD